MTASRIDVFKQILESDPDNTTVMFGLAKEYEKAEQFQNVVETLTNYLQKADDEGNAYGMLAQAYERIGNRHSAREALKRGISVAEAHGHPSMAADYRMMLEMDED
ncbi:MAG: hypothetical protein NVSMB56_12690 [Pyrinomonadaceae bacterium]